MNQSIGQFLESLFGNMDERLDEKTVRYDAAKKALDEGNALPLQREWEMLAAQDHRDDIVEDNHLLRIAQLWSEHLLKERRWEAAQQVYERALINVSRAAPQRFDALFALADVLRMQGKNAEAYTLLREHPLARKIELTSRSFPGSDQGARLAHTRFDFAEEARLHLLSFEPSPLVPIASWAQAMGGDEAQRRLKAAQAYYNAGQISRATEETQRALEVSDSQFIKTSILCLMSLWQAPRLGWQGVSHKLDEAQHNATSPLLVDQVSRLRMMEAVQSGNFARFEELAQWHSTDSLVQQQRAELLALQGRYEEAREWVTRLIDSTKTSSSSVDDHRKRAFALMNQLLVELYAIQGGVTWDKEETYLALRRVSEMLRGDSKATLWLRAYEATFSAALGQRLEADAVTLEVAEQWEAWSDDITTLKVIASQLGATFLLLQEWEKAIFWFERYLEIGKGPVYRIHHLEMLARALEGQGNITAARARREEAVASGFDIKAVELAHQALGNEDI